MVKSRMYGECGFCFLGVDVILRNECRILKQNYPLQLKGSQPLSCSSTLVLNIVFEEHMQRLKDDLVFDVVFTPVCLPCSDNFSFRGWEICVQKWGAESFIGCFNQERRFSVNQKNAAQEGFPGFF